MSTKARKRNPDSSIARTQRAVVAALRGAGVNGLPSVEFDKAIVGFNGDLKTRSAAVARLRDAGYPIVAPRVAWGRHQWILADTIANISDADNYGTQKFKQWATESARVAKATKISSHTAGAMVNLCMMMAKEAGMSNADILVMVDEMEEALADLF